MDPDALNSAARTLFDLADETGQGFRPVLSSSADVQSSLDQNEFDCVNRLIEFTDDWRTIRIRRIKNHMEDMAKFLAVHAAEQTEIDEFTSSMFNKYADTEIFPEASSGGNSDILDPNEM